MSEEQPADGEQSIEWMPAKDALEYLRLRGAAPWCGEPEALYQRLRARLVKACADECLFGRPPKPLGDGGPIVVPPEFWEHLLLVTPINWTMGSITARFQPLGEPMTLKGIEFARDDIEVMAKPEAILTGDALQAHINKSLDGSGEHTGAMIDVTPTAKPKKGSGGAPKDDVSWTLYWHSLIELALERRLTKEQFPTKLALRQELCSMMGEALSERTIRPKTSQVYRRFIDATATDDDD